MALREDAVCLGRNRGKSNRGTHGGDKTEAVFRASCVPGATTPSFLTGGLSLHCCWAPGYPGPGSLPKFLWSREAAGPAGGFGESSLFSPSPFSSLPLPLSPSLSSFPFSFFTSLHSTPHPLSTFPLSVDPSLLNPKHSNNSGVKGHWLCLHLFPGARPTSWVSRVPAPWELAGCHVPGPIHKIVEWWHSRVNGTITEDLPKNLKLI